MKERLKNLYGNGALSPTQLLSAASKGWVTVEDVIGIIGEDNATEVVRDAKIAEISAACNAAIVAGVDIQLGEETEHFNLSIEDQSNIANLFRVVELAAPSSLIRPMAASAVSIPPRKSHKSTSRLKPPSPIRPHTTTPSRHMCCL